MTRILAYGTEHRETAAAWHSGLGSVMYRYATTGRIVGDGRGPDDYNLLREIAREVQEVRMTRETDPSVYDENDILELEAFWFYVAQRIADSVWTADANDRIVHVVYDTQTADNRTQWRYVLIDPDIPDGVHYGTDMRGGCNMPATAREMADTLESFLTAHAESIEYADRQYIDYEHTESAHLFPWLTASISEDLAELIRLTLEADTVTEDT